MTETEMPDVGTSASRRPIERSTILITGATDGLGKGVATELVRGDVRHDRGLASSVRGMPWCSA